jgi:carbonic anhydrase
MAQHNLGIINKWVMHIKDVQRIHAEELQAIGDEDARTNRLVELNVIEQVTNLAKTSVIQKAWKDRQGPHLHGWVYGLDNGLIKPIFELPAGSRIDPLYEYDDL